MRLIMDGSPQQSEGIWAGDAFGRKEDAEFLLKFLTERIEERGNSGLPRSYVLNLDAGWGRGKTYFLKRFQKMLAEEGYLVAFVNAWRDDHADDPLIAVMAAIESVIGPLVVKKKSAKEIWSTVKKDSAAVVLAAGKGAMKHWAKKAIGEGIEDIIDVLRTSDSEMSASIENEAVSAVAKIIDDEAKGLFDRFTKTQHSIGNFREQLAKLLKIIQAKNESKKLPLFVMVDELDRCRPTYAVLLLERIKHLFEIDNVVFVIATDTKQLKHAIAAIYGANFDAEKYLFRFFDRTYIFDEPSRIAFVTSLIEGRALEIAKLSIPLDQSAENYITGAFDFHGLSARDCEQCIDIFRNVLTVWNAKVPLEIAALFPLIIGFQQKIPLQFNLGFRNALRDLSIQNDVDLSLWRFNFRAYSSFERAFEMENLNGLDIFAKFVDFSSRPIDDVLNMPIVKAGDAWVASRLEAEFRAYNRSGRRGVSFICEYPELIKSAGRLLPKVLAPH